VGDDDVRVFMYKSHEVETYDKDLLETSRERARWRIVEG
jgi:hypothetical protein